MQRYLAGAAVVALTAGAAQAGGIDRSGQGIGFMFEEGTIAEFSYGSVSPTVSGAAAAGLGGAASGDVSPSYALFSAAFKQQINDQLSLGVIFDQPFGADVAYPAATGYPISESVGIVDSNAVTAIARYKFSDRMSVHGGIRIQKTSGSVSLGSALSPGVPVYTMETSEETDYGYLIGAAYEIPEIALRAALTYNSAITHDFSITEGGAPSLPMTTTTPESINFDFQTGIAADTLLMASVRWADWSAFDISPFGYGLANGGASLVDYDEATISYSVGVGRRINDQLSGSISVGYEKAGGEPVGNLGPTDGNTSVALGVKYQINDSTALSGGLRHIWIGDAITSGIGSSFEGNTGWAAGFKLSTSF